MAQTIVGVNDAKAVKRYSAQLMVDKSREGYFSTRFEGKGATAMTPLQVLTELQSEAGDTINYDLVMQLRNKPIYGDNRLKGNEEALRFYSDSVKIDQVRCGVSAGGRMSRKRTLHDLRAVARQRMAEWWGRWDDETCSMYLAGARGINEEFIEDTDYTGYAGNAFAAPDTDHLVYGGGAVSKVDLDSTDKLSLATIDKLVTKSKTMGGGVTGIPRIRPIKVDGGEYNVLLMHPFQEYDLRTNTSTGQWLDIQKSIATNLGNKSPISRGGLGMYNNVVLHSHEIVIRFDDYGAGLNVAAARAVFMGAQSSVVAYGSPGNGLRMSWHEEQEDHGNEILISSAAILGRKKARFNSVDFGAIAVDTAAADPN